MSRTVTATVRKPNGQPWADFEVHFTLKPGAFTLAASYPEQSLVATTDADGKLAVELETGLAYEVGMAGSFKISGTSRTYPKGSIFGIVVPDGDGPISLEAIRALGFPLPPPAASVVDAVVAAVEARMIPPGGEEGQTLVKAADGDYAFVWADIPRGYGY